MSFDPNSELNLLFVDDVDDAFGSPEGNAAATPDMGEPDARGVGRIEPPGVGPGGADAAPAEDPGATAPNAGRANRSADLLGRITGAAGPDDQAGTAPRDVDTTDGGFGR